MICLFIYLFICLLFSDPNLQVKATNLLGGFLTHKETNMRFLSLEGLCNLALVEFSREAVRKHQDTVLNSLKVNLIDR